MFRGESFTGESRRRIPGIPGAALVLSVIGGLVMLALLSHNLQNYQAHDSDWRVLESLEPYFQAVYGQPLPLSSVPDLRSSSGGSVSEEGGVSSIFGGGLWGWLYLFVQHPALLFDLTLGPNVRALWTMLFARDGSGSLDISGMDPNTSGEPSSSCRVLVVAIWHIFIRRGLNLHWSQAAVENWFVLPLLWIPALLMFFPPASVQTRLGWFFLNRPPAVSTDVKHSPPPDSQTDDFSEPSNKEENLPDLAQEHESFIEVLQQQRRLVSPRPSQSWMPCVSLYPSSVLLQEGDHLMCGIVSSQRPELGPNDEDSSHGTANRQSPASVHLHRLLQFLMWSAILNLFVLIVFQPTAGSLPSILRESWPAGEALHTATDAAPWMQALLLCTFPAAATLALYVWRQPKTSMFLLVCYVMALLSSNGPIEQHRQNLIAHRSSAHILQTLPPESLVLLTNDIHHPFLKYQQNCEPFFSHTRPWVRPLTSRTKRITENADSWTSTHWVWPDDHLDRPDDTHIPTGHRFDSFENVVESPDTKLPTQDGKDTPESTSPLGPGFLPQGWIHAEDRSAFQVAFVSFWTCCAVLIRQRSLVLVLQVLALPCSPDYSRLHEEDDL